MSRQQSQVSRSTTGMFREFNRFYTVLIGSLARGYLDTEFTLQQARVIFEVATCPGCTAKNIRSRAGFEQAYLSRLITRLTQADIVRHIASAEDRREQKLFLTRAGRVAFKTLDARANLQARKLLKPLDSDELDRLSGSLQTVQNLLDPPSRKETLTVRDKRVGDLGWIFQRHAVVYTKEFNYSPLFEMYVCDGLAPFMKEYESRWDHLWIGEMGGLRVGSVAVHHVASRPGWAKLRWFLVEEEARGRGLGSKLLGTAVAFCKNAGYKGIFLWTVSDLDAARRLYERMEFKLVEEKNCAWASWAREQRWELRLC